MTRLRSLALVAGMLLLAAQVALAQEVGTIAAAEGQGDIGRGGNWTAATTGAAVYLGDQLRTGHPGHLRVVFQDDSVVTISDDSVVTIDKQLFDPDHGKAESLLGLLQGKLSTLVGEYYHRPGAVYEVKTPTAVGGVRGTEFAVSFDPDSEVTEVIGISGHVVVHSVIDPTGPGVLLTAREVSTVQPGKLPTAPRRLDDSIFRQQLEGIDFIGLSGGGARTAIAHGLQAGATVPPPDRAGSASGPPAVEHSPSQMEARDASDLVGQSPPVIESMKGQLGIQF
jgi:hypothetical protein